MSTFYDLTHSDSFQHVLDSFRTVTSFSKEASIGARIISKIIISKSGTITLTKLDVKAF